MIYAFKDRTMPRLILVEADDPITARERLVTDGYDVAGLEGEFEAAGTVLLVETDEGRYPFISATR